MLFRNCFFLVAIVRIFLFWRRVFMFHKDYGIILACDVSTLEEAESLAQLSLKFEEIVGYKIGFSLGLRFGLREVTKTLKKINPLPIIYDHQKAGTDIPQMGDPFARCCKEAEIDGVIVFAQAGPKTLESFISSIFKHGMTPIVGGVMTHPSFLVSDGGYIIDDAPRQIYQTALNKGVLYFVLPGNKPDLLRAYSKILSARQGTSVIMPGIGSQGGDLETAFNACIGLKSYAIIGSAIYKASDPVAATESFINSLNDFMALSKK